MGPNSVNALIDHRDNHRQHLSLAAAQRGIAKHDGAIKVHRCFHHSGVLAHNRDDVVTIDSVGIIPVISKRSSPVSNLSSTLI